MQQKKQARTYKNNKLTTIGPIAVIRFAIFCEKKMRNNDETKYFCKISKRLRGIFFKAAFCKGRRTIRQKERKIVELKSLRKRKQKPKSLKIFCRIEKGPYQESIHIKAEIQISTS